MSLDRTQSSVFASLHFGSCYLADQFLDGFRLALLLYVIFHLPYLMWGVVFIAHVDIFSFSQTA
jgi:hypothetical protein